MEVGRVVRYKREITATDDVCLYNDSTKGPGTRPCCLRRLWRQPPKHGRLGDVHEQGDDDDIILLLAQPRRSRSHNALEDRPSFTEQCGGSILEYVETTSVPRSTTCLRDATASDESTTGPVRCSCQVTNSRRRGIARSGSYGHIHEASMRRLRPSWTSSPDGTPASAYRSVVLSHGLRP